MAISRNNILYLWKKATSLLGELNISWWLGRGVLRNFYLTKEIGDKNSDLDFHIWSEDKRILKAKLEPVFSSEGYQVQDPDYKIAFYKPPEKHEFFVEFMLLIEDPSNPEFVYHARRNDKKYAPKVCFSGYETIQIDSNR